MSVRQQKANTGRKRFVPVILKQVVRLFVYSMPDMCFVYVSVYMFSLMEIMIKMVTMISQ